MKKILLSSLILCVILNGCYGHTETLGLKICGAYAVPGMLHYDLKGTETTVSLVEEDSEGRIMFEWSGCNRISGAYKTYLVICQAIEREFVYFYEDVCYIEKTETQETVASFKNANDWEKPLNKERLSFRPNKASFDLYIVPETTLSLDDIDSAFLTATGMELNEGVDSFLLDVSPSGQEMHCAKMGVPGKEEVILFIVSNNKACTLVKSTPLEINRTVFEELKKQANWQYGNDDAT